VIALSGRMDEESIAEVEALIRMDASGRRLVLDLRDVTLAGQEAVDFLARCEAAGIGLVHCAPYIREWITRQRKGG
jgi:hypothetical protein